MSMNKSADLCSNKNIAQSAGIIGLATLCSRILGFVRDLAIARLFGVYLYAQAFVIAFKIPNLLRDLVGEGATNAAFVPVFSEYTTGNKKKEFWELANLGMNVLLVILSLITLLGIIFSPFLVRLVAPGFLANPAQFQTTVRLTRIIFPYILLIGLTAYSIGVLNSLRHFTIPAFAPCLLNISIIIFALIWGEGIKGLASGVLVGGVLQLAVQIPVLYKKGFSFCFTNKFNHPEIKRIGKLMLPRLFSTVIYQLNNFVDTIFGSLVFIVGEGGVAALYFSYRLIQFPLGIFSNSLSQAILPTLSSQVLDDDRTKLKETLSFGLRSILFIMLPASIGFMVLSRPIIWTLFKGGKFDVYSVQATANGLFFYSIGLFAYGANKVVQCGFFALKDTLTPTKVAGLALAINIILNSVLMYPMKLSGLALATSISGIIGFFILLFLLQKKIGGLNLKALFFYFSKIFLASIAMGVVCAAVLDLGIYWDSFLGKVVHLLLPIASGGIVYIIFCFILQVKEVHSLWRWVFKEWTVSTGECPDV
jgi:putative peptidoglycan lipid II flippase